MKVYLVKLSMRGHLYLKFPPEYRCKRNCHTDLEGEGEDLRVGLFEAGEKGQRRVRSSLDLHCCGLNKGSAFNN